MVIEAENKIEELIRTRLEHKIDSELFKLVSFKTIIHNTDYNIEWEFDAVLEPIRSGTILAISKDFDLFDFFGDY